MADSNEKPVEIRKTLSFRLVFLFLSFSLCVLYLNYIQAELSSEPRTLRKELLNILVSIFCSNFDVIIFFLTPEGFEPSASWGANLFSLVLKFSPVPVYLSLMPPFLLNFYQNLYLIQTVRIWLRDCLEHLSSLSSRFSGST